MCRIMHPCTMILDSFGTLCCGPLLVVAAVSCSLLVTIRSEIGRFGKVNQVCDGRLLYVETNKKNKRKASIF